MKLAALLIAGAFAMTAGSALANDGQGEVTDPGEKQICKRVKEVTSRARSRKICMSQAQWDQQARDAQENLNNDRRTFNIEHGKD